MNKFQVTKIGLLNFWLFDDEVFHFSDGKLLLRGENGSGKSVTMQSFIPLILDGNKMPSRLDPFGSKEKRIEDYLLGPADGAQKEEAISYLYMETYYQELNKYITIGIGFRARKGRNTDFWGFALKDGRRIGEDFLLYKDYGQKVLLTKNELRARLGVENLYTEQQKEYKKIVNDLLFGFTDMDSYDEYINVLLQLRSSKLSKEYNPTKLMTILSNVLQPLTADDLRPLSEAIEDTNKTKEKVEQLTSQVKALTNFLKTYQNYNEVLLYHKASDVLEEDQEVQTTKKNLTATKIEMENLVSRLDTIKQELERLDKEYQLNQARLEAIDDKELKDYSKKLNESKEKIQSVQEQIKIVKANLDRLLTSELQTGNKLTEIEDKIARRTKEFTNMISDFLELCEAVRLLDVKIALTNQQDIDAINFTYIEERIRKYSEKLTKIKKKLEEKEHFEKQLDHHQEEYHQVKKEYSEKENDYSKQEKRLNTALDGIKDQINLLDTENQVVHMDKEQKKEIFTLLNNYQSKNYIQARELYQKFALSYRLEFEQEKSKLSQKLTNEKENAKILEEELEQLKSQKELEPSLTEEEQQTREKLHEKDIPFVPLYKAIEFKEELTAQDKDHLEELLLSMNILNALIVPSSKLKEIKNIKGVFLKKSPAKEKNLLNYVKIIDSDVPINEVKDVLSGISITEDSPNFIGKESYQLDFILGFAGNVYRSKYIGLLKRQTEQKQRIEEKAKELESKNALINHFQNLITALEDKIELVKIEMNRFPTNENLEEIREIMLQLTSQMEALSNRENQLADKILILTKELEQKLLEINQEKDEIAIPLRVADYQTAISQTEILLRNVYALNGLQATIFQDRDQQTSLLIRKEEISEELEQKNEELADKNRELNKIEASKKAIEEILNQSDYQNLLKEVENLVSRQEAITKQNNELAKEQGRIEEQQKIHQVKSNELEETLKINEAYLDLKNHILEREYELHYVYDEVEVTSPIVLAKKIVSDLKDKKDSDIFRAQSNYFASFNEYRNELLDYRINSKEILNETAQESVLATFTRILPEKEVNKYLNKATRQDLSAIYQGKMITVFELIRCLKEAILERESYISEQERHLFEDILLKTVGTKIRDRIESSKKWVTKMNEIMKNTQIDSNLSFQLEWRNKQAYLEEELDTKEIVRLFQVDAGMLNEKDSDKLINHFRSKIKQELNQSENTHENYSDIIFKVLDYRNWFEFKLYYKRKASDKKELTNKVFSILSGGERAKSMYVPLFAAIYAKLLSARNNALRIIALDEAFAGVDEKNIRELFDILTQLDLDYILTSQALWGDYDTVKDLAISELIKDEATSTVALRNYHWNGKVKEIIENNEVVYE